MSKWFPVLWAVGLWFSISMIGYGVALQRFASETASRLDTPRASTSTGGDLVEGKVQEISESKDGFRLKLDASERWFDVSLESRERGLWKAVSVGTKLRLRIHELQANEPVEIFLNPGTPFQRSLLAMRSSPDDVKARAQRNHRNGRILVLVGVALALFPVAHILIRRHRARRDSGATA